MLTEGGLTWGGEHTIQCKDNVLWDCASMTCIILLTSVTPINSIKKKKKNSMIIIGEQNKQFVVKWLLATYKSLISFPLTMIF